MSSAHCVFEFQEFRLKNIYSSLDKKEWGVVIFRMFFKFQFDVAVTFMISKYSFIKLPTLASYSQYIHTIESHVKLAAK
jgi:hypothetical protein